MLSLRSLMLAAAFRGVQSNIRFSTSLLSTKSSGNTTSSQSQSQPPESSGTIHTGITNSVDPKQAHDGTTATQEEGGRQDDLYRYVWLRCRAHQTAVLDSYETFLKMAAENLDIRYHKTETPWRFIKRRTLLRSRFVHKKARVQYEFRTYYRNVCFENLTGSTADTFLEYVERNLPEGVSMTAERHRLAELPFELEKEETT